MKRADEHQPVGCNHLDAVAELRAWPHTELGARSVVRECAKANDDTQVLEQCQLAFEVGVTVRAFLRKRLVVRRGTLDDRRDPRACQRQAVVDRH